MGTVPLLSPRCSQINMKYLSALVLCFCVLAITAQEDNQEEAKSRSARLFFVSSSSTTRTVNSLTYCYSAANTITAACRRKKRAIIDNLYDEKPGSIDPSSTSLESGMEEPEEANHRQGKFLLYWLTTTSTSTTTRFTATSTLVVASCTPASTTAGDLARCP